MSIRLSLILSVGCLIAGSAAASPPSGRELADGLCSPAAHIAEGAIGTDLTQKQSRFLCDAAAVTFWKPGRHVMVTFVQKDGRPFAQ